jgi:hypothetical protein
LKLLEEASSRLGAYLRGDEPEIRSAQDQSDEEKALAKWVRDQLEDRRLSSARTANEALWLTNIAYVCGIDSVEFDSKTKQFRAVNLLPKGMSRSRVHVNKVLPTVQNRKAKLCKSLPKWDVRPKSSDDEDKESARLGKYIILQDWEQLKINKKRLTLVDWLQQCGHAYFKVSWDVNAGPKTAIKKDGEGYEQHHLGEKRVDVCSPFEIFPDPLAKTWEEVNDLVQAKVRPLSYFCDQYERGHLVKEEDTWVTSLQYENRINSFNALGTGQTAAQPLKNTAIEISYYEQASKKHPLGRHLIVANGVLLKDGVLPIDEIPFAKFDDISVGGKYNSEAVVTHIRPMQDQYNRNKSIRAAWINRLVAGKYIASRAHNLGREAFNDQSGEIVEYDVVPNAPEPHPVQVPQIPQFIYQEDETLVADINDVSGINQTSRGQLESASIPFQGMQLLIEQDDTRIGVEVEQQEYSYADLGRLLLKFTYKYYTTPRLLKVAGKNMSYTVKKVTGGDLRENFDVHVIRGSTLPGSKVLNRQDVKTLHQEGYFGNPQDPAVIENVLTMLEFGDEFEPWKEHSLTMASIEKGIDKIEKERMKPAVSEFDNHPMWIKKLNEYRLSDRYERLEEDQKAMIMETMEGHVAELQKMVAPDTMEDEDADPELIQTDAAQQEEQRLLSEQPQIEPELPIEQEVMNEVAP